MKKLLILNGPNLNLVGQRETSIYGDQDLLTFIQEVKDVYQGSCVIDQKQSNIEGELIDALQQAKAKGYHPEVPNDLISAAPCWPPLARQLCCRRAKWHCIL